MCGVVEGRHGHTGDMYPRFPQESCPHRQHGGGGSGRSPEAPWGPRKAAHPSLSCSSSQRLANPLRVWRDMEFGTELFKAFSLALPKALSLTGQEDDTQPAPGQSLPGGPWRTIAEGARVLQGPPDAVPALVFSVTYAVISWPCPFPGYWSPSSKMFPEQAESDCLTTTPSRTRYISIST